MKSFKKKVSKILLSLTMVFAMALTIMPTDVFATANTNAVATATISDITIDGKVGEETKRYSFTVTINNDEFIYTSYDSPLVIGMIKNAPAGLQYFSKNNISKGDTSFEFYFDPSVPTESSNEPIEITIPGAMLKSGNDIVATVNPNAKWNILGIERDVTVNNGTGTDKYVKGDTVTITANAPATGKQFKEWVAVSSDVTLADSKSETTTFTMPDKDVEVTATYEDIPHTHTPATVWSKDDTNHWHECTANDGEKMDLASHTVGEWVIDTPATETTKGSKHRDCTVCSERETVEIPATGETPVITAGASSTHQISNGKDMTLTCSGKLEDLTGVYVDGKLVDASNYTLKSGSTILTLKASYLDTLPAGKHILKFQYKDNVSAETDFTIIAKSGVTPPKPSSPQTGDTSNTMLYFGLIILSGCIAGFGLKKKNA